VYQKYTRDCSRSGRALFCLLLWLCPLHARAAFAETEPEGLNPEGLHDPTYASSGEIESLVEQLEETLAILKHIPALATFEEVLQTRRRNTQKRVLGTLLARLIETKGFSRRAGMAVADQVVHYALWGTKGPGQPASKPSAKNAVEQSAPWWASRKLIGTVGGLIIGYLLVAKIISGQNGSSLKAKIPGIGEWCLQMGKGPGK
jgi:hypothetical protein